MSDAGRVALVAGAGSRGGVGVACAPALRPTVVVDGGTSVRESNPA